MSRIPFRFDVVQVAEQLKQLDSVTEVAQVQRAINAHNTTVRQSESFKHVSLLRIKRSVSFTGYLITPETYGKLRDFLDSMVDVRKRDVKVLANSIIITPKPASKAVLAKAGGLGKHMKWRITGLGIWASKL